MTYGEKAVGLSFSPGKDSHVDEMKKLFAEIIDYCANRRADENLSGEHKRLFSVAITEAQTAQMWAVKAITWKD